MHNSYINYDCLTNIFPFVFQNNLYIFISQCLKGKKVLEGVT